MKTIIRSVSLLAALVSTYAIATPEYASEESRRVIEAMVEAGTRGTDRRSANANCDNPSITPGWQHVGCPIIRLCRLDSPAIKANSIFVYQCT